MTAQLDASKKQNAPFDEKQKRQVQRLALRGYNFDCSSHLVLEVIDAAKAREFLGALLRTQSPLAFGEPEDKRSEGDDKREVAVNIGFTYRGLEALGLPDRFLNELRAKAPAFCEGAPARAAEYLGDAGPSAVERWDTHFRYDRAHVLVIIHGPSHEVIEKAVSQLRSTPGAARGLRGWETGLPARHLTNTRDRREVHFGFRDGIAKPRVVDDADADPRKLHHRAGELVLGYMNDAQFNRWDDGLTDEQIVRFFRNGSFAALRMIEQDEPGFNKTIEEQALGACISAIRLKAKLCGRWPGGKRVMQHDQEHISATADPEDEDFDFKDDPKGYGCPFGAHIRRTNPRADPIAPPRLRPLFRRGMPYGPKYERENSNSASQERGLMGLFFCASIEDQFEHLMSQWIEKKPMGPRNFDTAKDPFVGRYDGDETVFHIPRENKPDIKITGFAPFVTTRGTLYALFPGQAALHELASLKSHESRHAQRDAITSHADAIRLDRGLAPSSRPGSAEIDTAPSDRFCDIVMEGGVTSGIIYASAVAELSKSYRFSSIGGSSIGAFAAALTAAAEYNRRQHGSIEGFRMLERLPEELATVDEEDRTRLLRLFKPEPGTRRLFEIFLTTLNKKSSLTRLLYGLTAAIRQYRTVVLSALIVVVLLLSAPLALTWLGLSSMPLGGIGWRILGMGSWGLALPALLVCAVLLALLIALTWDLSRGLVGNGFGLCRGWSENAPLDVTDLDLAGFLHASIQLAAGRSPIDAPPLTFADLRDAPGAAFNVLGQPVSGAAPPSIKLQVYATNLAHGRPYRFPLDPADDMGRLFFKEDEMRRYFPAHVVKHLVGYSVPYRPKAKSDPQASVETQGYLELPRLDLPIVVAARMAMSFPLLISAVPLWAIDYEAPLEHRGFARCWMSDGGLCSNFPIHLFDSFLPRWPTFGISLQKRTVFRPKQCVWLPDKHFQGKADTWNRFKDCKGISALTGFLVSLWLAAWRWNDMTMMRMPGVRDRVVRIFLEDAEGGVNIKMSKQAIHDLSEKYGKPAAEAFVKKFAAEGSPGWSEHRWVRFNRLLIALRDQIQGFSFAANLDRHTEPMARQITASQTQASLRGRTGGGETASEKCLNGAQVKELRSLVEALERLEKAFDFAGDHQPYLAVPRPSLRIRHPT